MGLTQLQEELRKAVPHLKLIVPASVALCWLIGKLTGRGRRQDVQIQEAGADEEAAAVVVQVDLPVRTLRGPQLPFSSPRALRVTLLHVKLPVPIAALWGYLLSNSSPGLVAFHQRLGDADVELAPWMQPAAGGPRTRVLRYSTPVRNPLAPKQVRNREVLTAATVEAAAFVVRSTCVSAGAPFASSFVNCLQWVATAEGGDATRLHVTGECNFVTPVWGPLKGTIERESIKGMQRAYVVLQEMLAARFGMLEAAPPAAAAAAAAPGPRQSLRDYVGSQQMSPAVLVVAVAMMVLFWRMALLDTIAMTALRRFAAANNGN